MNILSSYEVLIWIEKKYLSLARQLRFGVTIIFERIINNYFEMCILSTYKSLILFYYRI